MSADMYLRQVLARYPHGVGPLVVATLRGSIESQVRYWGNGFVRELTVSGSNAKGTAIGGQSDVDFLVSISATLNDPLRDIYWSLFRFATTQGWAPRAQNVSIGVTLGIHSVDLVPARVQAGYQNRHSLYRRKADSWTVTDVAHHIRLVRESGRIEEIRLTKIWKALNGLEFPSLVLELAVLAATYRRPVSDLASNFWAVLQYLAGPFQTARLIDPSNTNNVVSDDLTAAERSAIVQAARRAMTEQQWSRVVW